MEEKLNELKEVQIRFSCLNEYNLTADLYILLHWKHYGNYTLPLPIKEELLSDNIALGYLQEQELIKITDTLSREFELRQKGIHLFETSTPDTKWLEFLGTFPVKVPARNGGTRPLKISDPNSKGNVKIKNKYINIIKSNPDIHDKIISVLKAEMKMRKDSGEMQYMHNMETWLNQADYDKFDYLLKEEKIESGKSSYGQELI